MTSRLAWRYVLLLAVALLAWAVLGALLPTPAHADSFGPQLDIPGWLQDAIDGLAATLAKTLQDLARIGGVLLWGVLKLCGMVGLFGQQFSSLFGSVITDALNAVITGSLHNLIRGSLMVSLGLFGLSMLARPFWPDLKLVSFQRAAIWGIVIQAYLLNAPTIYTELETWRVNLAEEVASAVSTGAIPGCTGDVVEVLLCITGTTPADVQHPDLSVLPDGIPYGGSESVRDLYDHCVYNPPVLYGHPACDPENAVGDPWDVLDYAQDALGVQVLAIIVALLILAYGVLQICLGAAAGMMFILFPVAGIFAFYLPLESFPAGVIRSYITIFLKSVVLLTLAGVVIRLFSVSGGSLTGMAAVALVDLLLCFIMAKEALASLLSAVSFVGSSVGNIGGALGLSGAGGGGGALPSPESRLAASMIGGGPVAQAAMGAPNPYLSGSASGGLIGAAGRAAGRVAGAPSRSARAALGAALAAGTGGAGAIAGAMAASRGSDYGSLALMGNAATTILGRYAGRGFTAGAGLAATRQTITQRPSGDSGATSPSQPPLLVPDPPTDSPAPAGSESILPAYSTTGSPASTQAVQSLLLGGQAAGSSPISASAPPGYGESGSNARTGETLSSWAPSSAQQIQEAATKLEPASPDVENAAFDLARGGHTQAQQWESDGRSPILEDGSLDPHFVEEVVQAAPDSAADLVLGQAAQGLPDDERLTVGEAVALGVTTQRTIPAREVRQGFGRAIKNMGRVGDLTTALRGDVGASTRTLFGPRAEQAETIASEMQGAGLDNDQGRQLTETVGEDLERDAGLTAQKFREGGSQGRRDRMRQWDRATGDPETTDRIVDGLITLGPAAPATVRHIPRPPKGGPTTARSHLPRTSHLAPDHPATGEAPVMGPLWDAVDGREPDLTGWTDEGARQIESAATRLHHAPESAQGHAQRLIQTGHQAARQWEDRGRSPIQDDGALDPQFIEEVIAEDPVTVLALAQEQERAGIPPEQQLSTGEAIGLGVATRDPVAENAAFGLPDPTVTAPLRSNLTPPDADTGRPLAARQVQTMLEGGEEALLGWTHGSARQIQWAARKLEPVSDAGRNQAFSLMQASQDKARQWENEGRSPFQPDGALDPQFVEEAIWQEPEAALALDREQQMAGIPAGSRLSTPEAIALGVAMDHQIADTTIRQVPTASRETTPPHTSLLPGDPWKGEPPAAGLVRSLAESGDEDISGWTPESVRQIRSAAEKLTPVSEAVRDPAYRLMQAGHDTARDWDWQGRSPTREDGSLAREFVEASTHRDPGAVNSLGAEQTAAGIPANHQISAQEAVALGAATETTMAGTVIRHVPRPETEPAVTRSAAPARPEGHSREPLPEPDPALFTQLGAWRRETAQERGEKAFYVFPDTTLQRIAAARPQTHEELLAVKGVGPKKLEQYGDAVLDITREQGEDA